MNLEKFLPIFQGLRELFQKYYLYQDVIDYVLTSINKNDQETFKRLVISNSFFGGSGALWEVEPNDGYEIRTKYTDAPKYSLEEKKHDRQKYYQLFIDLINELNSQGVNECRINQVLDYCYHLVRHL